MEDGVDLESGRQLEPIDDRVYPVNDAIGTNEAWSELSGFGVEAEVLR